MTDFKGAFALPKAELRDAAPPGTATLMGMPCTGKILYERGPLTTMQQTESLSEQSLVTIK